ncbi:class I SAM-dependent methyltransferase [Crossiella sp. NPDC003009]
MIGRKLLPEHHQDWNKRWHAPFGDAPGSMSVTQRLAAADRAEFGPFAFQWNSVSRVLEYPWAYHAAALEPGMRVLEVGGGLSGLQYVLAMEGCAVTNVDPSAKAAGDDWGMMPFPGYAWTLTPGNHELLNRTFGTDVRLVADRIQDADLPKGGFDRVLCLSVLEHLDPDEGRSMVRRIAELLAPGGRCLLTIDLFLDVRPFGVLDRNVWGANVDVRRLVRGLELVEGDPRELFGFPEFDQERVVDLLPELFRGNYPALSQTLVLRKWR